WTEGYTRNQDGTYDFSRDIVVGLMNKGNDTFQNYGTLIDPPTGFRGQPAIHDLAVGDIDGDGKADLVLEEPQVTQSVLVYAHNAPTRTGLRFDEPTALADGPLPDGSTPAMALGDFVGNGHPAIAAWGSIFVPGYVGPDGLLVRNHSLVFPDGRDA